MPSTQLGTLQRVQLAVLVALTATTFPLALRAQPSRDSAGVLIVENTQPAWKESERLWLAPKPLLVIGNTTDSAYLFRQIRGVMRFADGHIAVADGGSLQLRMFSPDGRFLSASAGQGSAPGQIYNMSFVRRLRGDTIAIDAGFGTLALYSSTGAFGRTAALEARTGGRPPQIMLVAVLNNGLRVAGPMPNPASRATGTRWTDSLPLKLFDASNAVLRELGMLPYMEFEQGSSRPSPPWLSPIGAFAGADDRFFAGYGDRYAIRMYGSDGQLQSIIRRAWTPVPITPNEWEQWVVEWSKLWITSTGERRDRDVQKMREAPYATVLPAFSEFIVDRTNRLWVREAHWQDAIGAGSLTDIPRVPSNWSVFDTRGRWLGDVQMPADFQPYEIGADYVAGKTRSNGVSQVAIYGLGVRSK